MAAGAAIVACIGGLPGLAGGQDGFVRGEALATADTFTVNIKQANADIGFTYGRSTAGYRDRTASASGEAIDLGVLPLIFADEQCDGSEPPMNPNTLPQKVVIDSENPSSETSRRTEAFLPGTDGGPHGPSVGFQDATASTKPASRALTESVDTDMFLLALDGGRTEVRSRIEGTVREAHAVSTADELRVFGGLFTFSNPRWEATVRSGTTTESTGSFTFETATVLGFERTHDEALRDFTQFERGLESLLRPLGVALDMPTVEQIEGGVEVTPMAFRVVDPPFGAQVLAPFFESTREEREAAMVRELQEDCTSELEHMLLDVILSVLSGSGSIEILAGGVDAFTADTDFSSPPPMEFPAMELALPPMDTPLPDLDTSFVSAPEPTTTTTTTAPEVRGATEQRSKPRVIAAVPSSRYEDTPTGPGVAVGVVGLLGALGLTVGERLLARRNSRRIL